MTVWICDWQLFFPNFICKMAAFSSQRQQWSQKLQKGTVLVIVCNTYHPWFFVVAVCFVYQVAVNNSHFIEYAHRVPLHKASTLNISGDVKITSLRFQWTGDSTFSRDCFLGRKSLWQNWTTHSENRMEGIFGVKVKWPAWVQNTHAPIIFLLFFFTILMSLHVVRTP